MVAAFPVVAPVNISSAASSSLAKIVLRLHSLLVVREDGRGPRRWLWSTHVGDTSPTYLYFMKYSCHVYNNVIWFWYDLIRTNPDWRCFQQNNYCALFLCRNNGSPNVLKIYDDFLWTKRDPRSTRAGPGSGWGGHKPYRRALTPREGALDLWAPRAPPWRETNAKNSYKYPNLQKEP